MRTKFVVVNGGFSKAFLFRFRLVSVVPSVCLLLGLHLRVCVCLCVYVYLVPSSLQDKQRQAYLCIAHLCVCALFLLGLLPYVGESLRQVAACLHHHVHHASLFILFFNSLLFFFLLVLYPSSHTPLHNNNTLFTYLHEPLTYTHSHAQPHRSSFYIQSCARGEEDHPHYPALAVCVPAL